MPDSTQRDALLLELATCLRERASGLFYIATADNRAISLSVLDGFITYCGGGRVHGRDAVALIATSDVASFSFNPSGDYPFRAHDEVVHEDVMAVLGPLLPESVDEEDAGPADSSTGQKANSVRMYRGRPVAAPEPKPDAPRESDQAPRKKPVRYYRGQRIED